jgi:hypothetical protein
MRGRCSKQCWQAHLPKISRIQVLNEVSQIGHAASSAVGFASFVWGATAREGIEGGRASCNHVQSGCYSVVWRDRESVWGGRSGGDAARLVVGKNGVKVTAK